MPAGERAQTRAVARSPPAPTPRRASERRDRTFGPGKGKPADPEEVGGEPTAASFTHRHAVHSSGGTMSTETILLVILIVFLLGGGGFYWSRRT
jgi:hypothetical protein